MRRSLLVVMLMIAGGSGPLRAQVISPGKLSSAHASLEGVRQCKECHELGQRGISNARCLSCHSTLEARVERGIGFHATVTRESCSTCHKDHLGRSFDVLRLDTGTFKHERTGFVLKASHGTVTCRQCHTPEHVVAADVKSYRSGRYLHSTFLGLGRGCESCHAGDSPHGTQFGVRKCEDCHDEADWKRAVRFDHATTRYALTGEHRTIECAKCHPGAGERMKFTGIQFATCASCHRDPHAGRMAGGCTTCHSTAGWARVDAPSVSRSFDHARTDFPLRGAHARAGCAQCHQPQRSTAVRVRFVAGTESRTFARPVAQTCGACHVNPHPAGFARAGTQSCASCHTERAWLPASYDVVRHNRTGAFALTGAHVATPCLACHVRPGTSAGFLLPERSCNACHARVDPHKGKFGSADCAQCHNTTDFRGATFDHKLAAGRECAACHANRDPHNQQFAGRGCDQCHGTQTFSIAGFNHTRTSFSLDGAHARVACSGCHKRESTPAGMRFVRYKPLANTCRGCHGGGL